MKWWLIFLCTILSYTKLYAQFPALKFSYISTEQGLSNRVVTNIYQDKNGFIWAGTNDGLNRLDGYRIKQFYYSPKSQNNLSNNVIYQITGINKMWVSTESGINFLNKDYSFSAISNSMPLSTSFKANILEDGSNTWICYKDSLYLYTNGQLKNIVVQMPFAQAATYPKKDVTIKNITKDALGNYWAWSNNYIMLLSIDKFIITKIIPVGINTHEGITFAKQDTEDKNILWIGTWGNGLYKFDIKNNVIKLVCLKKQVVHDITNYTDVNGNKWLVAATNNGITVINKTNYSLNEYLIGETFNLLVDKQNILWIASANGIVYVEPQKQWFNTIRLSQSIDGLKNNNQHYLPATVSCINNNFYVGIIYGKGVAIYNENLVLKKYLPSLSLNSQSKHYNTITNAINYNNSIWFSTDSGLVKCNSQYIPQKIIGISKISDAAHQSYNKLSKIIPINDSLLLLKSPFAIHIFNLKQEQFVKTFTHINNQINSLPNIYLSDITLLQNNCFISTDNGLLQLNYKTGNWSWINKTFANTRMQCITAKDSMVWIGTQTGLSCYNINTKTVKNYYRSHGLSSDNILNIIADNEQRIWLNTANGLTCFETTTNNFTRIYKENGLPENLLEGLLFSTPNGKIFTGSIDAITWFYANKILQKKQTIKATITEIETNNEKASVAYNTHTKSVCVAHNSSNISVHFALLNYNNTTLNKYFYILEGASNKWQESKNGFLQFNNLKPGNYKLYVSSVPYKNAATDELIIKVLSPFYQTWWFITIIGLIIVGIVLLIISIRAKALKEKVLIEKNYVQQLKEAEMQSLRSQMNPHFIFNTLNAINSFIVENKTDQASDYLVTFSKLVRNILENSRYETISLDKEIAALKLYLQLEQVRLEKSFNYNIIIDSNIDIINIKLPPLIVQPFVENAIWHGLRNSNIKGNVWIDIKYKHYNLITISVIDDGIGITAASKLKASQINHKSYGIEITQKRITLLNEENKIEITDRIINNKVAGTIVTIYLNIL